MRYALVSLADKSMHSHAADRVERRGYGRTWPVHVASR